MVERKTLADDLRDSGYKDIVYLNFRFDPNNGCSHKSYRIIGISEDGAIGETYSADGEIKQSGVIVGKLEKLIYNVRAPANVINQISAHLESEK